MEWIDGVLAFGGGGWSSFSSRGCEGWVRVAKGKGREGKGRETPCEIERLGERNARFYGWLFACVYDVM